VTLCAAQRKAHSTRNQCPTDLTLKDMLDHMELPAGSLIGQSIVHWADRPPERVVSHARTAGNRPCRLPETLITTSRDVLTAIGKPCPHEYSLRSVTRLQAGQSRRDLPTPGE